MGLDPRTRPSRRPDLQVWSDRLVALSWRGGLPHAPSRHGSASRDQAVTEAGPPGSELLIWQADTRRDGGMKGSRRPLDCGEHRRSLPARSAVPATAFARMQTAESRSLKSPPGDWSWEPRMDTDEGDASLAKAAKLAKGGRRMVPLPTLVQGLAAGDCGGAGSRTPLSHHGSPSRDQAVTEAGPPGSELLRSGGRIQGDGGMKGSRRPLDCGEHRRSLPARSAVPVAAFAIMQTAPPGLRNSHEFR